MRSTTTERRGSMFVRMALALAEVGGHRGKSRRTTSGPGRKTASDRRSSLSRSRSGAMARATSAGAWPTDYKIGGAGATRSKGRERRSGFVLVPSFRCRAGFLIRAVRDAPGPPSRTRLDGIRRLPPSRPYVDTHLRTLRRPCERSGASPRKSILLLRRRPGRPGEGAGTRRVPRTPSSVVGRPAVSGGKGRSGGGSARTGGRL